MKKTVCGMFTVLFFISAMLTGCTSSKPFEVDDIATTARVFGIQDIGTVANANTAIEYFKGLTNPSGYYISKDYKEAQTLYDNYLNRYDWYPKASVNKMVVVVAKEFYGTAIYDTDCCLLIFPAQSQAKSYYDSYVSGLDSKHKNKTGYKGGYAYAITYSLSANRDGNCDWMKGVYLKGNSVLIISGFSPIDDTVKTFSDQIYSSLDLIDPATLNK